MRIVLIAFFLKCLPLSSFAQDKPANKLKVYLDCRAGCDDNYIRTEIKFIDFVTDRLAADVHLLINSQVNGSGGKNVVFNFYGQHSYKNKFNTMVYNQSPNTTANEIRIQVVKRIRLGLVSFHLKHPASDVIDVQQHVKIDSIEQIKVADTTMPVTAKDKWNYWVFKMGVEGNYNAEENYTSRIGTGSFSANRTTDKIRFNFSGDWNDYTDIYKYEQNGSVIHDKIKNKGFRLNHFLIKSISQHWSLGYVVTYSNNTFSNNKSRKQVTAGIEYAIFPYKEVNNKFFAISYNIDVRDNRYYDTTIFDKLSERLYGQKLQANLVLNQKWGNVDLGVSYHTYIPDLRSDNLSASLGMDVRVTGGLSFFITTYGSLVHDQVYLHKKNASVLDILTRRRQLASGYYIKSTVGINFRFGSIFNNFVNPRFSNNYD